MTFSKAVFIICGAILFVMWIGLAVVMFLSANHKLNDLDCADFKTQADAQTEFNSHDTDRYGLDNNKNGIACELLPR